MKSFTLLRSNLSTTFLQSLQRLSMAVLLMTGLLAGNKATAQTNGIYESYALVNINNAGNAFYDLTAATGNPDFSGANLGTYNQTQTLVLAGAQNKTFKCNGGNISGGNTYYRIWLQGGSAPGYTTISPGMSFVSNDGGGCGGNQTWQTNNATVNLLQGLGVGTYNVEVYTDAPGTPGTATTASFTATFIVNSVFGDNFNRATLSPGGSPSMTYTTTTVANVTATTTSNFLNIASGATGPANGAAYVTGTTSTYASPYSTTLSSNTGIVTWTTNFRWNRASSNNPAIPASGSYGSAIVLAGSSATVTGGNGYAIIYGSSGTPDPIRLVAYAGGVISGTLTDICTSGINDLANTNNYASIRVTYNPTTNSWSLFVRDDGASAWADPISGVTSQKGSTTANSTHTGSSLATFGFVHTFGTAVTTGSQYDNFNVQVASSTTPTLSLPTAVVTSSTTATLGATVTSNGGSTLTARGTSYKTTAGVVGTDNQLAESGTSVALYTHSRTGLSPQTPYFYVGYATNGVPNTGISSEATFLTWSNPATVQPATFTTTSGSSSLVANWGTATFPASGATQAGYVVIWATGTPTLSSANGVAPAAGVGTLINIAPTVLPTNPALTTTITGLVNGTLYNLLIVPYTWDGTNPSTYNYFTAGARTTTGTPAAISYTWNSGATGAWTSSNNWLPSNGVGPLNGDAVTFNTTGSVGVTSVPSRSLTNLTISQGSVSFTPFSGSSGTMTLSNAGTALSIASGASLTLNGNSSGTPTNYTLAFSGTGNTATIAGTLNLNLGLSATPGAGQYIATNSTTTVSGVMRTNNTISVVTSTSSNLIFSSTGEFNVAGDGGALPTANWNVASTLRVTGVIAATGFTGATVTQAFGNIIWESASQTAAFVFVTGSTGTASAAGSFTVNNTNSGSLQIPGSAQPTFAVSGSLVQTGGILYVSNGSTTARTLTVAGNFVLNQNTTTSSFIISETGSTGIHTMNVAGNFTMTAGTMTRNAVTANVNFNGNTTQTISKTGGTVTGIVNFIAPSASIVSFPASSVLDGTTATFNLNSGATLRTANTAGISSIGATGSIQVGGTRTFSTGANYNYNGSTNQVTGNGLPATVNTLTINNTGTSPNNVVTLTAITAMTATANSLTLTAGQLDLNAKQLTIPTNGNVVATSGDFTATAGPLFFLGAGTTTGTMNIPTTTLGGTVTFNSGANIVTSLQINASGAVQVAPTYGAASTLIYNSGTTYNRFNEWTVATSGAGYPNNIALQNNTTLNVVNGVNQFRRAAGNLTVNTGSTFSVADLTTGNGSGIGVEFLGNIINDGTISINTGSNTTSQRLKGVNLTNGNSNTTAIVNLSGANGGDLELTGNYVDNAVLNANTRAVFFTGAGVQTISGTATAPFNIDYVVVTKASGSVQLGVSLLTGAPNGGNGITLSSATDILDLNGNTFTLGTAGQICTIAGNGFIRSNSGTPGSMVVNGTGDATGTLKFETGNRTLANLTVNRTSTGILTLGTDLTVATALTLTDAAFNIGSNTLTINGSTARTNGSVGATSGTVTFNGAAAQSVPASIFTGNAVANLNIPNANGVTFNGSAAVSGIMTVNGLFTPVAATVISGAGTVTGTGTIQVTRAIGTADLSNQYSLTRTLTNLTTEYIGAAAQGIAANTFGGLKISNSNGVNMAGDVTVGAGLNLNTGNLTINANILTLNGAVSRTSGNLTGSNTSNLVIAGAAGTLFFNGNYTNTNNYLKNLTINNGASATLGDSLNITGGTALNTEGTLTVTGTGVLTTGGFLTIKSNINGTARIAANTSGATYISGNATVERYIPQNGNRAWRLLAAPASGQTIKAAWQEGQTNVGNSTVNTNSGFGTQITGSVGVNQAGAQALGFDEYTPGASMYRYDSSTNILRAIINTKDSLIAAYQGYFLYIRGDRSQGISSSTTTLNATTLRTNGVLNLGTKTTPVVANKSALLGNPFASAINLKTGITYSLSGSVGATTFRVWDPKLSTVGAYQTLAKDINGDYIITPGGGSYVSTPPFIVNTIESGQAFFISGGSLGGDISITESSKTTGSRQVFRPSGNSYPALFTNIYSVTSTGNKMVDGNFVAMDASYTNLVDDYDGRKQSNFNENFGMLRDGVRLAVEKRLPFTVSDTVFYNMNQMRPNNYLLELRSQNIDPSLVGILEDNYLNSRTPVGMNNNTTYNFSVDANAGSFAANRFRLVFGPMGGPLPVTFININAAASGTNIAVQWKVGSQLNLAGYEIEKSTDGRIFRKVGTQATTTGSTETLYNWMDVAAVQGNNFYRIKAIDVSGAVKYSGIVKVILGKAGAGISISPNPVKGNTVNLQFTNQQAGVYNIRLINTAGQVLTSLLTKHAGGSSFESFTISSLVVSGVYQLEIIAPNKTKQVQKLIIDTGK